VTFFLEIFYRLSRLLAYKGKSLIIEYYFGFLDFAESNKQS
jgi:hypothetical protein